MLSTGFINSNGEYIANHQYGEDFQGCCNDLMANLESLNPNMSSNKAFSMVQGWLSEVENNPNTPVLTYYARGLDIQYFVVFSNE